ncbi:Phosphomevalonate kinase [Spathaspora sp. JA1]|nr:Phosphomevalonate kinase [Spathaspora sp. JA1]
MSKAYSAPGKALLAGGYLVIDPIYNAYVTALSSRMHAIITPTETTTTTRHIKIQSPQFVNGVWEYNITSNLSPPKEINGNNNPFLEAVLFIVLAYIEPESNYDLTIDIYSDPGYHTQENTTLKQLSSKSFLYHSRAINEVEKTGLGSSAGLVAVVTTALVSFFKPSDDLNKDLLHNIAQIAHCYAQKKIGSGFDVAAAIYGSIIFKRFQPEIIDRVFDTLENNKQEFVKVLKSTIESNWDFKHTPCSLPRGIRLVMGDIKGGSETPKLVSTVLNWKKNKPQESSIVYANLDAANNNFISQLKNLHEQETPLNKELVKPLSDSIVEIRKCLQDLTKKSGAAIEPQVQTDLLDKCQLIPGVIGGVVPGAGGYDAISLLVLGDESVDILKKTTELDKENYNNVTWVNLHEESEGIIIENAKDY